jgi:hypothetical protein
MAPNTARPMISTPVIASCLGQQRDAPRARFALRSLAGGEQPPLLRPAVKPAEAHSREDDHEIDRRYEHGEPPSLPARRTDPSVTSVVMPEATVPALRSASGPRTNSGAGQTMHPAGPVRQKNEAQPTRAPGHPVTGRRPLAGSARLADRDGRPTASGTARNSYSYGEPPSSLGRSLTNGSPALNRRCPHRRPAPPAHLRQRPRTGPRRRPERADTAVLIRRCRRQSRKDQVRKEVDVRQSQPRLAQEDGPLELNPDHRP